MGCASWDLEPDRVGNFEQEGQYRTDRTDGRLAKLPDQWYINTQRGGIEYAASGQHTHYPPGISNRPKSFSPTPTLPNPHSIPLKPPTNPSDPPKHLRNSRLCARRRRSRTGSRRSRCRSSRGKAKGKDNLYCKAGKD